MAKPKLIQITVAHDDTIYARIDLDVLLQAPTDNSIEEYDYRVVGGIIEARLDAKPKSKRRSDAGQPKLKGLALPLQDAEIDEECR